MSPVIFTALSWALLMGIQMSHQSPAQFAPPANDLYGKLDFRCDKGDVITEITSTYTPASGGHTAGDRQWGFGCVPAPFGGADLLCEMTAEYVNNLGEDFHFGCSPADGQNGLLLSGAFSLFYETGVVEPGRRWLYQCCGVEQDCFIVDCEDKTFAPMETFTYTVPTQYHYITEVLGAFDPVSKDNAWTFRSCISRKCREDEGVLVQ